MVIYKFGGASVKNVEAFHLLKDIVSSYSGQLIVVVSAMGKTTNRLEEIVKLASKGSAEYKDRLHLLNNYHLDILSELIPDRSDIIYTRINDQFITLGKDIEKFKGEDFNFFYDQVVSVGEIISTLIVSRFLEAVGVPNKWLDIRGLLITNDNYRDALVNYADSESRIRKAITMNHPGCYVTQGFIGSTLHGHTTTLGREGSDFSAALLGYFFEAEEVTLWKDVDGIYNADPAIFSDVILLEKISYQEMIELAFYGAKVIHPKTIKPLREKKIPLFVRSFYKPMGKGSIIGEMRDGYTKIPTIINKKEQILISISLEDLSFITEFHISKFFGLLNRFRLKANLMQHSAVSLSVCVDEPRGREVRDLIAILRKEFRILYNDKLTLYTIRHYTDQSIADIIGNRKIYVEQRSRNTVQYLTD
jgi:aspartate kinase